MYLVAVQKIDIKEFLKLGTRCPVLDVRSPAEYEHAHIPGAFSLPLFSNEERKIVGTIYKQNSREAAIKTGLDFFGPKMRGMVEQVEDIVSRWPLAGHPQNNGQLSTANCILVHCWRGGMRSAGVAWLLDLYGFKVYTLAGGYKAYRNYVRQIFECSYNLRIVGGYTGSGKTMLLKELEKDSEKIIDLEGIACHKGSAFGAIGQPVQPTQEMFENILAQELKQKTSILQDGSSNTIWLEDESQRIGLINIPQPFWEKMRQSPIYFIDIPFEERLEYVIESYGKLDKEKMVNSIIRIRKRLGGLETKSAINYLLEDDIRECFRILLKYYDKYYLKGLNNRVNGQELVRTIVCEKVDTSGNAESMVRHYKASMLAKF